MDNVIRMPSPRAPRALRRTRGSGYRLPAPNISFRGGLREVQRLLPRFERRQFGQGFAELGAPSLAHPRLHAIVDAESGLPVGVVSPDYALIQHSDALAAVAEGLALCGIPGTASEVTAELSTHGEQMLARISLPGVAALVPSDGFHLQPIVTLSNSVDGKSALRANLGWFRLICMNGLIVPYATGRLQRRHSHGLSFPELARTVAEEFNRADATRRALLELDARRVGPAQLAAWVDGPLRERWGAQAATRVFHILWRGMDVTLADPFEQADPSFRTVDDFAPVPGSRGDRATTAYDALQALTWVASRSENLMQRWEREAEALGLVERLAA